MNKTKKVTKGKEFEAWLSKYVPILIDLYGIGGITVLFHEKKEGEETKKGSVVFRINYSTSYKTANLWYYPSAIEFFNKKNFGMLRQALTHEIAHIITNPLGDLSYDRHVSKKEIETALEALTETVGQLARKLMDAAKIEML